MRHAYVLGAEHLDHFGYSQEACPHVGRQRAQFSLRPIR
jgi:hypothetical protein